MYRIRILDAAIGELARLDKPIGRRIGELRILRILKGLFRQKGGYDRTCQVSNTRYRGPESGIIGLVGGSKRQVSGRFGVLGEREPRGGVSAQGARPGWGVRLGSGSGRAEESECLHLSLIHISEPTRPY